MNGNRGGRGGGGFRGGRGGGGFSRDQRSFDSSQSSSEIIQIGTFVRPSEGDMLCRSTDPNRVPYFNAPIYLANRTVLGKVDEILGPINQAYFSVKVGEGVVATSFRENDPVYIGADKVLPLERFLPKPKGPKAPRKKKDSSAGGFGRGGSARGARGGRGDGFARGGGGGRGGSFRGSSRGGGSQSRGRGSFSRGGAGSSFRR